MSYGPATIRRRRSRTERALRRDSALFCALVLVPVLVVGGVSFAGRSVARPSASPDLAIAVPSRLPLVLTLPFPVGDAHTVIQGYESEFTHTLDDRYALDFGMRQGQPVLAVAAGRVVDVVSGWGNTYPRGPEVFGNLVKVDHGDGLVTVYAHLRDVLVRKGQEVARGSLLGTAGSSGYSTRTHLHFRITRWGAPVRPEPMSGYGGFAAGSRYVSDNVAANTRGGRDETAPGGRITSPRAGSVLRSPGRSRLAGTFTDNVIVARVTFYWRYADEGPGRDRMIGRTSTPRGIEDFSVEWTHRLDPGRVVIVRAVPEDAAGGRNGGISIALPVASASPVRLARTSGVGGPAEL